MESGWIGTFFLGRAVLRIESTRKSYTITVQKTWGKAALDSYQHVVGCLQRPPWQSYTPCTIVCRTLPAPFFRIILRRNKYGLLRARRAVSLYTALQTGAAIAEARRVTAEVDQSDSGWLSHQWLSVNVWFRIIIQIILIIPRSQLLASSIQALIFHYLWLSWTGGFPCWMAPELTRLCRTEMLTWLDFLRFLITWLDQYFNSVITSQDQ